MNLFPNVSEFFGTIEKYFLAFGKKRFCEKKFFIINVKNTHNNTKRNKKQLGARVLTDECLLYCFLDSVLRKSFAPVRIGYNLRSCRNMLSSGSD